MTEKASLDHLRKKEEELRKLNEDIDAKKNNMLSELVYYFIIKIILFFI